MNTRAPHVIDADLYEGSQPIYVELAYHQIQRLKFLTIGGEKIHTHRAT